LQRSPVGYLPKNSPSAIGPGLSFPLIGREVRMGSLDAQAAARAGARFEAMVDESFSILLPTADDFGLAKRYLGRFETGLRAGDALHLAVANNHCAAVIYSLYETLLKAGKILDLPVSLEYEVGDRSATSR
jgi:uncharacterized protein